VTLRKKILLGLGLLLLLSLLSVFSFGVWLYTASPYTTRGIYRVDVTEGKEVRFAVRGDSIFFCPGATVIETSERRTIVFWRAYYKRRGMEIQYPSQWLRDVDDGGPARFVRLPPSTKPLYVYGNSETELEVTTAK
jgi:hypothetical protein